MTGKQIQLKLQTTLNKVQSVLNYDKNKTYKVYFEDIDLQNIPTIYANEIRNSLKLEEEILPFLVFIDLI